MRLLARGGGLLDTRRRHVRTGCVTVLSQALLGFCTNRSVGLWSWHCACCVVRGGGVVLAATMTMIIITNNC